MTADRRYRTAAMSLVDRQFAFAGPKVLGKFLDGLLAAYPEIDPTRNYPVSWFVFRVTGVVARDDDLEAQVVSGVDLLADAASLASRLASRRGPTRHDPDTEITATAIAAEWGVSRRTLQRWRDDGLPMVLARFPDGVARSVCRREIVACFAARHHDRVRRAFRKDPSPTIEPVVDDSGRRPSAADPACSEALRRPRRNAGGRRRVARLVARARSRLVPATEIATRIDRSLAVVRRLELAGRLDAVAAIPSPAVTPPNLDRPDAAEVFGVAGSLDGEVSRFDAYRFFDWLEAIREHETDDEESDRARIAAMNFALARARHGVDAIRDAGGPIRERDVDLVESHLRWWGMLLERAMLAGLNPGLRRFEQSLGRRLDQLPASRATTAIDLLLDGVSEGIRGFDPTRRTSGHGLARSVGLAVSRRVARESGWTEITGAKSRPIRMEERRIDLMAAVPDPARSLMAPIRWWRSLDAAGRSAFAGNPGLEPFLIRFGLDAPGRPRSLLETGRLVGRPPTRWSGGMESLPRSVRGAAVSVASPTE